MNNLTKTQLEEQARRRAARRARIDTMEGKTRRMWSDHKIWMFRYRGGA